VILAAAAVVAITGILLAVSLLPAEKSRPVAWHDLTVQVGPLTIADRENRLFRDREQLDRYLARAGARGATPQIDFSRRQLLLVSPGPRSSTGYEVEVLSVSERDGEITVRVREQTPALEDRVEARVTHPYSLLSLPADGDVAVDWIGR
jgi:PrcB C-terminal